MTQKDFTLDISMSLEKLSLGVYSLKKVTAGHHRHYTFYQENAHRLLLKIYRSFLGESMSSSSEAKWWPVSKRPCPALEMSCAGTSVVEFRQPCDALVAT